MPQATDLDLTSKEVVALASSDAVTAFLARLGYDTDDRTTLSPEAVGLSGESANALKRIELLSEDPEQFLRVVFAQPKSLTAKVRYDLTRVLGKSNIDHLLILASDFDTLEFVLLDKRKQQQRGPAGGERIQVVAKTISVNRRNPTRLDLRTLRRLTWTCRDALEQFDKLRSVFDAAAYTGEYFQNRGLFADHYLRERLRDDPAWGDNPSEMFAFVRDLLKDAPRRWSDKDKDRIRNELLVPIFNRLGFKPAINRPSKSEQTQPDYLLKDGAGAGLSAAFFYPWDRWLDGPDIHDPDTPEENPGALVVTALDQGQADWIIVTNGRLWRLYSRQAHARATNFYEVDLVEALTASGDTDPNEAFRYWWLFFRAQAFLPSPPLRGRGVGGEGAEPATRWLDTILRGSRDFAKRLGDRLKDRVFVSIFPHLAEGFLADRKQRLGHTRPPTEAELADVFEGTLTLLYRLLFLLYAESRDLLPVREAPYHAASFKKIKEEIAEQAGVAQSDVKARLDKAYATKSTALYDRLGKLFQAMDNGDPVLNVPRYNGGLFNTNPPLPAGTGGEENGENSRDLRLARFLQHHKVPDRYLAPAIDLLARDQDEKTLGLVFIDYKSLEVRHLGSIYEGLLEFKLKVADEDLTTQADKKGERYIPLSQAKPGGRRKAAEVVVAKGNVYLSNDKAERKASGSYYTPDPIVEYIVAQTVGPVLAEKLEPLRADFRKVRKTFDNELQKSQAYPSQEVKTGKMDHRQWAGLQTYNTHKDLVEKLFDLRVLDPAMGSGHFLVEAVDFITDNLLKFLNQFPINPVNFALERTRASILESLGQQGVTVDPARLTDIHLLKRHVLKRCIYGVDLNPMAVELAKVSLWLDAFTLGAPLNFLDHHLRCGNSLVGATFADLEKATATLFALDYEPLLRAINNVLFISKMADATADEVAASATQYDQARHFLAGYQIILDLLVAEHFGLAQAKHIVEMGTHLDFSDRKRFYASLHDDREKRLVDQVEALAQRSDLRFFHWDIEFPEVFFGFLDAEHRQISHKDRIEEGSAGFDCVIGNPPYGGEIGAEAKESLLRILPLMKTNPDTAVGFIERAASLGVRACRVGLIVPKPLTYSYAWRSVRKFLARRITNLVDMSRAWKEVLLEQVIVLYGPKNDSLDSYSCSWSAEGRFLPHRAMPWALAERFETLPCALDEHEIRRLASLNLAKCFVGDICKTYRGIAGQDAIGKQGTIPVIGGRDLERWRIRSCSGFLRKGRHPFDLGQFERDKLVFQNIIAHVATPRPHILLMGAHDSRRTVTLDTVNNLVPMEPTLDLYGLLGLLHSDLVNWFVYSVIYNKAIRTMHFDQYFLNKIPLPDGFESVLAQLAPLAKACCSATETIAASAQSLIEEVKQTTGEDLSPRDAMRLLGDSQDTKEPSEPAMVGRFPKAVSK